MGWDGVERGFARNEARRHECFAKAGDLEMLLLRARQHELRSVGLRPRLKSASPGFSLAGVSRLRLSRQLMRNLGSRFSSAAAARRIAVHAAEHAAKAFRGSQL